MFILTGQRAVHKPESGKACQSWGYQCAGRIWKVRQ